MDAIRASFRLVVNENAMPTTLIGLIRWSQFMRPFVSIMVTSLFCPL